MEAGSYLLIKRGMTVQGVDGTFGTVADVVADMEADIFRGIVVSHGMLMPKQGFVMADDVVSVGDDGVHVRLTKAEADHLPAPAQ